MCGIFGISSIKSLFKREEDFIKQSTFVGTLRGYHSTGLTLVDGKGTTKTYKRALAGPDFAVSSTGQAAYKELSNSYVVLGHNRAATSGQITDDTAHPYDFGDIVGCHNGTLRTEDGLTTTNLPVDSMNLLHSLSKIEDKTAENYIDLLKKLRGSFALTWYEIDSELLYLVHNEERPLYYWQEPDKKGNAKAGETLFWASEKEMLHWILARCRFTHEYEHIKPVPQDTLCVFDTRKGELKQALDYKPEMPYYNGWHHPSGNKQHNKTPTDTAHKHTYTHDNEFNVLVENVAIKSAIERSLWAEEDEIVTVFFDQAEKVGQNVPSKKLLGTAVTNDGEAFPCAAWVGANAGKNIKLDKLYIGNVVNIKYTSDNSIILNIIVAGNSLEELKIDNATDEEAVAELWATDVVVYYDPWVQLTNKDKNRATQDKETKVAKLEDKREEKKSNRTTMVKGPKSDLIQLSKFYTLTAEGCSRCSSTIHPKEAATLGWENRHGEYLPICQDCLPKIMEQKEG